jgi:regulator of nucleoside diphosphate kinase
MWRKEMRVIEADMVNEGTIYITEIDRLRLEKLIEIARERDGVSNQEYLDKLEVELERAETVASTEVPRDVITMRSRVRLRDLNTGEELVYSLVFPTEANFSEGKISILAPIGTAMLGYSEGSVIDWKVPSGSRRLKVEEILYQPEAAGDYNS